MLGPSCSRFYTRGCQIGGISHGCADPEIGWITDEKGGRKSLWWVHAPDFTLAKAVIESPSLSAYTLGGQLITAIRVEGREGRAGAAQIVFEHGDYLSAESITRPQEVLIPEHALDVLVKEAIQSITTPIETSEKAVSA